MNEGLPTFPNNVKEGISLFLFTTASADVKSIIKKEIKNFEIKNESVLILNFNLKPNSLKTQKEPTENARQCNQIPDDYWTAG